jgi:hypothetical protein
MKKDTSGAKAIIAPKYANDILLAKGYRLADQEKEEIHLTVSCEQACLGYVSAMVHTGTTTSPRTSCLAYYVLLQSSLAVIKKFHTGPIHDQAAKPT